MGGRTHAGAAAGLYRDEHFGQDGFREQGVAHHADIGAQPYEFDFVDSSLAVPLHEPVRQIGRSECGLLEHAGVPFLLDLEERGRQLPTPSAADAVLYGQVAPLLRLQVVFRVSIQGEHDLAFEIARLLGRRLHYAPGLFGAQRAVDEIVLHVHHYQDLVRHSLFLPRC